MKLVPAVLVALGLAISVSPAAADPAPQSCDGQSIANFAHIFGGRRAAAESFRGDYPQAVRDAERFLKSIDCV